MNHKTAIEVLKYEIDRISFYLDKGNYVDSDIATKKTEVYEIKETIKFLERVSKKGIR